ncbi:1-phosphatidylinositol 4,5-bisphosphate phosphodiesterase beta-1 [Geodia barretti]|nr:1-phosphatidylinositol 4,5-bisphosphate phosphodiesterase beta-1 [Geodia barretti]
MYGLPADTVRHKYTKKAAAPHPFWNEPPFTFKRILLPELAILRIAVFDDDRELVGQRCLPVSHIRPGFRYIPLRDKHNQPLPMAMLFVNIKVEDWVPNEMEDVVAMLMDPISFATKALEELAKGDDLDDLGEEGTEVDNPGTDGVPQTTLKPSGRTDPDQRRRPRRPSLLPRPPRTCSPLQTRGPPRPPRFPRYLLRRTCRISRTRYRVSTERVRGRPPSLSRSTRRPSRNRRSS